MKKVKQANGDAPRTNSGRSTKKEFYLVKSPVTHKIYTVMITPSQADAYRRRNYEVIKI